VKKQIALLHLKMLSPLEGDASDKDPGLTARMSAGSSRNFLLDYSLPGCHSVMQIFPFVCHYDSSFLLTYSLWHMILYRDTTQMLCQ